MNNQPGSSFLWYGFLKSRSTTHALINSINYIRQAIYQGNFNIEIFLDLAKVFDTISQDTLFNKLEMQAFDKFLMLGFKASI